MSDGVPNFFVVGAAKAGTTSLYAYLREHPQVFMSPVKEPHFFSRGMSGETSEPVWSGAVIVRDWDEYVALFSGVRGEIAIGEASPSYLDNPEAARRIRQHLPDARIIAILRDPIERAYSGFQMQRELGAEQSSDFLDAVMAEGPNDSNRLSPYLARSLYAPQLQRYLEYFPAHRIQIHLYDDLKADAVALVRSIFRFLGVEDRFEPNTARTHHKGGAMRSRRFQAFLKSPPRPIRFVSRTLLSERVRTSVYWTVRDWNMRPAALPSGVRRQLLPLVRDDILATQDLIDRDLSAWLDPGDREATGPTPAPVRPQGPGGRAGIGQT